MRLWHEDMIPFLPRAQLLAQWRELNSIFAKEDQHILINYIYDFPKDHLYAYTKLVVKEFEKRGYQIRTWEKMNLYFKDCEKLLIEKPFPTIHDDDYFEICFYNLKEKYIRGQKDFSSDLYTALESEFKKRAPT